MRGARVWEALPEVAIFLPALPKGSKLSSTASIIGWSEQTRVGRTSAMPCLLASVDKQLLENPIEACDGARSG